MKINKWKKILSYYKPYKKIFAADLFFSLLNAIIVLTVPMIIRYITSEVLYFEKSQAIRTSIELGVIILILFIILYGCNYFVTYYGHIMGAMMERDMRSEIFEHYQKLSFQFYDNRRIGDLMSRITVDLNNITEILHHLPEEILTCGIRFIGAFIIFFVVNWKLAIPAVLLFPMIFACAVLFAPKIYKAFKKNHEKISQMNSQIEDSLSGVRVVKSFANEDVEIEKFETSNRAFVEAKRESFKLMSLFHPITMSFVMGLIPIITMIGVFWIINKSMNISDLITFMLYIDLLIGPIFTVLGFFEQFNDVSAGYNRFIEVLEIEPDIIDSPNAIELENAKGGISFKNVFFNYENHESIFNNLNLEINSGDYVALVGSSGVGKTTLCNLISRFYDVTEGSVELDGKNVKDISLRSLRDNIGIVQQDLYLFAGTIKENILYGKPDASEEEMVNAAKNAHAHEFIINLPDGYNTSIGQRGVKISGGQKQRLAIARVFLKNPAILILDEATSALDNESERFVQESLDKLASTRTTLVIAHRLSTIRNAKKILIMTKNGISETGTHEELLIKNGDYAKFYKMQFDKAYLFTT